MSRSVQTKWCFWKSMHKLLLCKFMYSSVLLFPFGIMISPRWSTVRFAQWQSHEPWL
jgi:hypothetical protein